MVRLMFLGKKSKLYQIIYKKMENLITDPSQILALMPLLISKLTGNFKIIFPKWSPIIVFLPYFLGVLSMTLMWFAFNEKSLAVYILNWVIIWLTASWVYDDGKKKTETSEVVENKWDDDIHSFTSIKDIW